MKFYYQSEECLLSLEGVPMAIERFATNLTEWVEQYREYFVYSSSIASSIVSKSF